MATWADLFDRADAYECAVQTIRDRLAERRTSRQSTDGPDTHPADEEPGSREGPPNGGG